MLNSSSQDVVDPTPDAAPKNGSSSASTANCRIVLRKEIAGTRDLRAALLDLAAATAAETQGATWVLATRVPRMTAARVAAEWHRIAGLLRQDLAARMGVVAFAADGLAVEPGGLEVRDRLAILEQELPARSAEGDVRPTAFSWTPKTFAVWHALLESWLNAEGPTRVEALQRRSGCSYPTARAVVDHLSAKRELSIRKDRSVAFASLPRHSLEEVLVGGDRLRGICRYIDATGARPDAERLLRRVLSRNPVGVQIGGVAAARHYLPNFDLNGLPRLDLLVTRSARGAVNELDPGLEVLVDAGVPALVVVHEQHGSATAPGPYASAADTFLDLLELHLTEHAVEFASKYRQLQEVSRG